MIFFLGFMTVLVCGLAGIAVTLLAASLPRGRRGVLLGLACVLFALTLAAGIWWPVR